MKQFFVDYIYGSRIFVITSANSWSVNIRDEQEVNANIGWKCNKLAINTLIGSYYFLLFNRAEAHILLVALRIAHVIRRDEHQLRYEYIVE